MTMYISKMSDGNICYGVDYSKRNNCEFVLDITDEQATSLQAGLSEIIDLQVVLKPIEEPIE